jgi:hypothetical protein
MELTLNLVWALVAFGIVGLWLRFAPCSAPDRRTQLVALVVLILILFPVISVTDDLQATQNPAELDSSVRRGHGVSSVHFIVPTAVTPPQPALAELSLGFLRCAAPSNLLVPTVDHPGLAAIQNRPPPSA